jgi:hypothetical protein
MNGGFVGAIRHDEIGFPFRLPPFLKRDRFGLTTIAGLDLNRAHYRKVCITCYFEFRHKSFSSLPAVSLGHGGVDGCAGGSHYLGAVAHAALFLPLKQINPVRHAFVAAENVLHAVDFL